MTLATVSAGTIIGEHADGIHRYLGIPFAEPPVGTRRFAAPVPVAAWGGVRETVRFGATAPQNPYAGAIGELLHCPVIEGDNMLTVNVWTPNGPAGAEPAKAEPLPVVLWVHGGAFERGTSAQPGYDGSTFARDGVVFVSANYRLGPEGFSVLEGAPSNLGLLDCALALEWVHREIAAFGGDPSRITLMGESAGGSLVAALLARPASRKLVAGAIIQSGPLAVGDVAQARRASDAMAKRLGIPATRDGFASVPPAELLRARAEIAAGSSPLNGPPGFVLTVAPDSLPTSPESALVDVDVPILIGTNTDEYRLWLTPDAVSAIGRSKSWLARRAMRIPERAARAVRRALPDASPGEVLGQLVTDRMLRAPATRLARSRTAPTYVYEFAWPSPVRDLRAAHAVEIAFAFDRLEDEGALRLSGADAPAALAREMHAAWVAFITHGAPGWEAFGEDRITRVWDEHPADVPQRRAAVVDALG